MDICLCSRGYPLSPPPPPPPSLHNSDEDKFLHISHPKFRYSKSFYWTQVVCYKSTTVEPRYNEVLWTMKFTSLYQVSHYIRVKKQRNIKSWDQQTDLVIRGFCYIRPLYNEVPLYIKIPDF